MKSVKEMIEVMQAYADGKAIEYTDVDDNNIPDGHYIPYDGELPFDWIAFDYRIKSKPKNRPMTFDEIFEWWKNHKTEIIKYKDIQLGFDRYGIIDCMDFNGNTICVCGSWMKIDDFFYSCTKEDGSRFEVEE